MSQSLNMRFAAEPVRTAAAAAVMVGYTAIGTALANPCRQFFIQNLTDQSVMISFDGINDAFPLPANGFIFDDVSANNTHEAEFFLPQGMIFYVKQIGAPATGSVYVSVFYAAGVNV